MQLVAVRPAAGSTRLSPPDELAALLGCVSLGAPPVRSSPPYEPSDRKIGPSDRFRNNEAAQTQQLADQASLPENDAKTDGKTDTEHASSVITPDSDGKETTLASRPAALNASSEMHAKPAGVGTPPGISAAMRL